MSDELNRLFSDEDNPGVQILGFLASVRPLDGENSPEFESGKSLVEQYAYRQMMSDEALRSPVLDLTFSETLTPKQCTTVLEFLRRAEPRSRHRCYAHMGNALTVGYMNVLGWVIEQVGAMSAAVAKDAKRKKAA